MVSLGVVGLFQHRRSMASADTAESGCPCSPAGSLGVMDLATDSWVHCPGTAWRGPGEAGEDVTEHRVMLSH